MQQTVTAILAAAGSSTRMGFDKLAFRLGEHTVLEQSVLAFDCSPAITSIVLVVSDAARAQAQAAALKAGDVDAFADRVGGLRCEE